jgi:UDP-2,3-diacylglucosamine pyrophosphatase LpxH
VLHYLRGNHDPDPQRAPPDKRLDGAVLDEMVHVARDGRRYLVLHGDVVDGRLIRSHVMTRIGSRIEHGIRVLDRFLSVLSRSTSTQTRTRIEALLSFVNALSYRSRQHKARLIAHSGMIRPPIPI